MATVFISCEGNANLHTQAAVSPSIDQPLLPFLTTSTLEKTLSQFNKKELPNLHKFLPVFHSSLFVTSVNRRTNPSKRSKKKPPEKEQKNEREVRSMESGGSCSNFVHQRERESREEKRREEQGGKNANNFAADNQRTLKREGKGCFECVADSSQFPRNNLLDKQRANREISSD